MLVYMVDIKLNNSGDSFQDYFFAAVSCNQKSSSYQPRIFRDDLISFQSHSHAGLISPRNETNYRTDNFHVGNSNMVYYVH